MTDLDHGLAQLDPRRRELLERVLRERGVDLSRLPVTPRGAGEDPAPLSYAQERLWVLDRLDAGGAAAYNEAYAADLAGPLDPGALAAALGEVVRRHEGLRTRFPAVAERPVQVVEPPAPVPLPSVGLEALPEMARCAEVERLAAAEAARPFDLAQGPLLRAVLLHRAPADHRLLLTLHHVVCDARSLGILFSELEAVHEALRRGEPPRLPPPPVHYPDFAVWQRRWLRGEVLERELGWWRRTLDGFPTHLEVPADRRRGDEGPARGGRLDFEVDGAVAAALADLCRSTGATSFMAWLAAFGALLHRYTGRERLLVGTPVENRRRPELADVVGFFVNTLALPVDLGGDPGLRRLLTRLRTTTVAAYDHQDLPFARLVDALAAERTPRNLPLVQVFFVLQRAGQAGLGQPGGAPRPVPRMPIVPRPVDGGAPKFDLTLVVDERPDGVRGHLDYDAELFLPETAARLVANLRTLVAAAAAEPDRPLSTVPLLAPEERRQVLVDWRGGAADEARPVPAVLEEIARRAAEAPGAPALVAAGGRTVSYGELAARAGALAGELVRRGVGPEVRVGLIGGRTPETVVGVLGILAAGGVYVPLDPELPAARREAVLTAAGVSVTVVAAAPAGGADGFASEVVEGPAAAADPGVPAAVWPVRRPQPESLAYVIHTSGSTGRPKGVMVSHAALDRLTQAFRGALALTPEDRLLMVPAPSFDASVGNLFPVLAAGAALVLHPDPAALAPDLLGRLVDDLGVTVVDLPAAFWKGWVDAMTAGEAVPPRGLRLAVSGGESLDLRRVTAWLEHTGAVLFGPYGPTETTVCATAFATTAGWRHRAAGERLPIGRPLPHAEVSVVDRHGQPVPVGATGELTLGGGAVARGYLGRPAETADRFRPDPWGAPGSRAYRSGDLGRWLAGGDLEFGGRRDEQVKVRGYRVEPGEVEAHLRRHPRVRDAAVAARQDGTATRLVAWVAGEDGEPPSGGELTAFLTAVLPAHMVPATFVPVERLPTTSRGKVDRDALTVPAAAERAEPAAAPRDAREAALLGVWIEVLGRDGIGVHDDFFRAGGESILALRVASRARLAGLAVAPKQLFRHRTVAELAAVAEPLEPEAPAAAAAAPTSGPVPLTPIQRWFLDLAPADLHHWNQAQVWELPAGTRDAAWRRAVEVLVERHDALRLRLVRDPETAAGWRQEAAVPAGPAPYAAVDLTALPAARRPPAWERVAAAVQQSLDPSQGPLLRLARVAGGGTPHDRLLLAVHHLGVDTASWTTLEEDLEGAYLAATGRPVRLPPGGASFRTWAEGVRDAAGSARIDGERALWHGQTPDDLPPLPQDLPGGAEADVAGRAQSLHAWLDDATTAALVDGLPRSFNANLEDALLAALARAFQRWTGDRRLLVELEGHGREDVVPGLDVSRTVGWFTAAYPLLLALPARPGAAEALLEVKEQVRAVPRRGVGYGILRWLTEDGGGLAGRPRPQVAVNYLGTRREGTAGGAPRDRLLRPSAAPAGPLVSPRGARPFPLQVAAALRGGRLWTRWTWSPGRHRGATLERLSSYTLAALRDLAVCCEGTDVPRHTSSDFPHARLDRRGLDKLAALLERTDAAARPGGGE